MSRERDALRVLAGRCDEVVRRTEELGLAKTPEAQPLLELARVVASEARAVLDADPEAGEGEHAP